jgi:hypothetical protein
MESTLLKKFFWITGVLFGIFVSIKITSLLLALPLFLAHLIWYRHEWKKVLSRIFIICLIGIFIFYILNPDYWFAPLPRAKDFFYQSITRKIWTPFTVYFGGQFYKYRGPFYYPLTMFLITTPILHIILLFTGIAFVAIKKALLNDFKVSLIFIYLLFPFIILALPISPAHDGIRYLLPAYPFMACFMAIGLERFIYFVRNNSNPSFKKSIIKYISAISAIIILAIDIHNPARVSPFELSYYNKIIGELPGAHKNGYESTYWWEIINSNVLDNLNKRCMDKTVYYPLLPTDFYFKHMTDSGKILFKPSSEIIGSDYMLIIGRPYVEFWEAYSMKKFQKNGKIPVTVWSINIDGIPLLKLYKILSANNE